MNKKGTPNTKNVQFHSHRYWMWAMLIAIMLLAAGIRIRLLQVPLERDEGEYAYAGQLILDGIAPYDQVYNMKMPGIYAAYAAIIAIFGQTHTGIHMALLFINAATTILLFLLAKQLFHHLAGLVAASAFALLSLGQNIQGIFANAEHFVIFFALAGILLVHQAIEKRKNLSLLAGAVMLGLAFLMKQHGIGFIVFSGFFLLVSEFQQRPLPWKTLLVRIVLFSVGVLLPFAVTCLILWKAGVFEKFWFWTFDYALKYISAKPLLAGLNSFIINITSIVFSAPLIWTLACIGLASMLWNRKYHHLRFFTVGFLFFPFLAVCSGFYFRPHYFILVLPAVALLAGIGADPIRDILSRSKLSQTKTLIPILLALVIISHSLYRQRDFFFKMTPTMAARNTYSPNPFPESLEIARFIRENTDTNDRIAVIGSEPQIYFYSNRRSATGYIYTYPLMENHPYAVKMQQEMAQEIEKTSPEFLVFVNVLLC
ncbi:MAG: glycosyltransferase family 39 protein [Planctomycetota bacterium]|jgi:4-amino-4-deoxy-L-arabinose transferase-like glycosyltransferase